MEKKTTYEEFEAAAPENRRLLRQEGLILEVTEALCLAMEREGVNKVELAARLGKTRGFMTHLLGGGRNLTLRTIADIADALGYTIKVEAVKARAARKGTARKTA